MSLVEYRTPLYFNNKDSYKSVTSGILTILSGLVLVIIFFIIFMPIFRTEKYISDVKQIKIRGEYTNGTVESCTSCTNLSVGNALESIFNGITAFLISSAEE